MLKQLFKNAFQPKEAKFGFNVEFVNGTLNHNPISNLQAGKCALNFEKQTMTIKQNNNVLTENMTDVESIRTWSLNRELFFIQFNTKTYNEYKFKIKLADSTIFNTMILQVLTRYADAFGIPITFDGNFKENDNEDDE